ncbi:MAG TPA: sensor histidine kinase [Candidatus Binatia bacterium]|nr:sensor histidine kinase [Candidatus Binatia bacterium]
MTEELERAEKASFSADRVVVRRAASVGRMLERARAWVRVWAVGFVLWTVLAFLSAAGAHVYTASIGSPESWPQLLAWNLTISWVWSLLTPPVYALSRRFTFDRSNWRAMLPLHLAASITLTFLAASLIVWIEPSIPWIPRSHVPFFAHVLSRAFMDLQRYWYILLITQAIGYYGKYRERELQSSQLEAQLAHAQLEVLKIQLEPHFLFNTLNSIAALARNDGPAAENMTLQLADLLRFSLDAVGVHEVPLSRELTVLQKYIDIQQTRFQERLQVEMDIAGNTLSALVPNMLLQPLVENAIRHGIGPRRAPGNIRISSRQVFDELWIEICDNGVGLTCLGGVVPAEGVGLRNTRARLQQLYNHDHRLTLEDAPGGGCIVKIHLPFRTYSEEVSTDNAHSSVA